MNHASKLIVFLNKDLSVLAFVAVLAGKLKVEFLNYSDSALQQYLGQQAEGVKNFLDLASSDGQKRDIYIQKIKVNQPQFLEALAEQARRDGWLTAMINPSLKEVLTMLSQSKVSEENRRKCFPEILFLEATEAAQLLEVLKTSVN